MPARVKCAELAWRTLEEMLEDGRQTSTRPATRGERGMRYGRNVLHEGHVRPPRDGGPRVP